ncbi:MAG TPA: hypothetical protein RMF84_17215 [Polyangiaceae bacterium LLY-WYZ-14_1]|nr:hypothetical protein [Polyangiaceae bacterium LLY-WYZ-14_1]
MRQVRVPHPRPSRRRHRRRYQQLRRPFVGATTAGASVTREILLYTRPLHETELDAVETYLATRHAITLP